jgi:hypothetical protein
LFRGNISPPSSCSKNKSRKKQPLNRLISSWFLLSLIFRPWGCSLHVLTKRRFTFRWLHDVKTQKIRILQARLVASLYLSNQPHEVESCLKSYYLLSCSRIHAVVAGLYRGSPDLAPVRSLGERLRPLEIVLCW